jgi:hypothetical protein
MGASEGQQTVRAILPQGVVQRFPKPAHVIEDNGDGASTVYETFAPGNIPNKMNGGYVIQNR